MTDSEMLDQIARSGHASGLRYVLAILEPFVEYAAADAPLDWDQVVKARKFVSWAKTEFRPRQMSTDTELLDTMDKLLDQITGAYETWDDDRILDAVGLLLFRARDFVAKLKGESNE